MRLAEAVQVLKGLAEPNRLKILQALLQKDFNGTSLADHLSAPQTRVGRHLRYLKKCGWVQERKRRSVEVHYTLAAPGGAFHRDLLAVLSAHLPRLSS